MTRRRRPKHFDSYRGWRPLRVTVTCRCGWVSENHRSRGEARRAYESHVWLTVRRPILIFGVDARRVRPL